MAAKKGGNKGKKSAGKLGAPKAGGKSAKLKKGKYI